MLATWFYQGWVKSVSFRNKYIYIFDYYFIHHDKSSIFYVCLQDYVRSCVVTCHQLGIVVCWWRTLQSCIGPFWVDRFRLCLQFSSRRHRWPWPIVEILFRPFGLVAPKPFKIIWLSNLSILSVPDEGYSRRALRALNLSSMISAWVLGRTTMPKGRSSEGRVQINIYTHTHGRARVAQWVR